MGRWKGPLDYPKIMRICWDGKNWPEKWIPSIGIYPMQTETLVLCDNYGQAGAINYYTKTGIKATSFNADYIDWFDL